jgi:uncharacterized protein (TIGR03083 family)
MLNAMDTPEYGPCDPAYHIASLRREGELLAGAAEQAGFDALVPACPGWRVRDLLKHLGYVHRWATGYVREQHAGWVDRASEEEILDGGPGDGALARWFRDGHAALVRTLEAADPGMTCWTFLEAPSPVAFWARRQAHETAMHRVDAQQAAAGADVAGTGAAAGAEGEAPVFAPEFPARFAADGVDELIMGFLGRDANRGSWDGPSGTWGFHAVDGDGGAAHWRVAAEPGQLTVARENGVGGCDVTGPAADLYLLLWNRRDPSGLDVRGDPDALADFRRHIRVTWR